jgi:hypothetical protein
MTTFLQTRPARSLILLTLLLLLGLAGALTPHTTRASEADTAELVVVLWATPNVQVMPGEILAYQVQVKNFNRSAKSNIRIYIPYDRHQLEIIGADFEDPDDWISEISDVHVLVTFAEMAGLQSRTATIYARVADYLPVGTAITTWPSYSWRDSRSEDRGEARSSNALPVLVGETNEQSPFVWLAVEPRQGNPQTTYSFFSDRFLPFEPVELFVVTPSGPIRLDQHAQADERGRIWFDVAGASLPRGAGSYHLLAHGLYSNLQAQTPFDLHTAEHAGTD